MEFGAFVNFFGKQDGLVHISQLTQGRPETVGDVVKEARRSTASSLASTTAARGASP